jgi:hypothetical protein
VNLVTLFRPALRGEKIRVSIQDHVFLNTHINILYLNMRFAVDNFWGQKNSFCASHRTFHAAGKERVNRDVG